MVIISDFERILNEDTHIFRKEQRDSLLSSLHDALKAPRLEASHL